MRMEKVAQHLSLLASNFSPLVTTSGQPQCLTNENFRQAQGLNAKKAYATLSQNRFEAFPDLGKTFRRRNQQMIVDLLPVQVFVQMKIAAVKITHFSPGGL